MRQAPQIHVLAPLEHIFNHRLISNPGTAGDWVPVIYHKDVIFSRGCPVELDGLKFSPGKVSILDLSKRQEQLMGKSLNSDNY